MPQAKRKTAVVTGASSGIGAATAERLAREGFDVVVGARRVERLDAVAERAGARALPLDVTDEASVERFAGAIESVDVLVNNAGLALGMQPVAELDLERARTMWETNVLGLVRVTQALLPKIEASGAGHIVNLGSTAGIETYPGGGGYTASKHALRALTRTLRIELLGKPIRITEIAPGMVETEFSQVRFDGDADRAAQVYEGLTPLSADDIADCVAWAVTRPPHVNIDEIVVRPVAQATSTTVARHAGL
ncbi:MAG TPA: SDR family NAD(P)-dependent oxidoreductase [Actinomycetota bacterium]|nr:SDR family NAD(P)-dependent oxidoreductase [Actinomycetota bacterium]